MPLSSGIAGIYARISLDRSDGEGVERQLADCRALVEENGWEPREYVDNDRSAFRAMKRPAWDQMLEDLRAGQLDHVVAYHTDRLYRRLPDLEDFIDIIEASNVTVHTLKSGVVDLSNASGRMHARISAAFQRGESERIGERVSRAKQERARQGRPAGGGKRPYGLDAQRSALVPEEAVVLREVAQRVIAGSSYNAEVTRLNEQGLVTSTGGAWTIGTLRRILTSPHVAGLRAYKGEITGPASWPAILDMDTWERLRAMAASRKVGRRASDQYLLTGLIQCGECGHSMFGNQTRGRPDYRCAPTWTSTGRGCGGVSIRVAALDEHVVGSVTEWLDDPEYAAELDAHLQTGASVSQRARTELDDITQRRNRLAERWALGEMDESEYEAARAILQRRQASLEADVVPRVHTPQIAALRTAWEGATVPERRAILPGIIKTPILIHKGSTLERVTLLPPWQD